MAKKEQIMSECVTASGAKCDIASGASGWDKSRPVFVENWSNSPHTGLNWSELKAICDNPTLRAKYQIYTSDEIDATTGAKIPGEPLTYDGKPVIDAELIWQDIKTAYFDANDLKVARIKYSRGQTSAKLSIANDKLARIDALMKELGDKDPSLVAMMTSIMNGTK